MKTYSAFPLWPSMVQSYEASFSLCHPSLELHVTRGKSGVALTEQVTGADGGGVISLPVHRRGKRVGEKSNPGGWALVTLKGCTWLVSEKQVPLSFVRIISRY